MKNTRLPRSPWLLSFNHHVVAFIAWMFLLVLSSKAQTAPGWTLTFSDEFNGTQLDLTKWNTSYMWGGCGQRTLPGNHELEVYLDNQFEEANGILRIRADDIHSNPYVWSGCGTFNYASGVITTYQKFSQLYGYFEIRARLPKGKGLWPAFWMLDNQTVWPPEIDAFEVLGDAPSNPHIGAIQASNGAYYATYVDTFPKFDTSADFHVYGLEWDASHLTYYMDGKRVGQTYAASNMNVPMQLIANLAVGGSWPGSPDSSTVFPAYYDIDYIRAWTRSDSTALVPGGAPVGLTAAPGNSLASLGWTAVTGATSYNVQRATTDFGPYTAIATGVTTPSYTDTGLTNGTTYYYVVTAITSGGESKPSAQAPVTPVSGALANRNAVADAFVRDGNYASTNYGTDPTLQVKLDATGYNRESFLRFDVSGLANATSVKVRLIPIATGPNANASTLNFAFVPTNTWSEATITWNTKPASTNLIASVTGIQQGAPVDIDITTWAKTQAGIDGLFSMRIYSTTTGNGYVTFGSNDQTVLAAAQPVLLIVGSTTTVPSAPTGLTATAGDTRVSLSWTASAGATSYNVKRAGTSGGPYTTIASPSSTNYVDTGLADGVTYYYVVSAVNSAGESTNSSEASATPSAPPSLTDVDIGGPSIAGSASLSGGTWTVSGSGSDISVTNDQFNYDYRSVTGDTTIVARVASQQNTNAWAKSGVMIRETLSTYSRHVDLVLTPSNGVAMDYRSSTSGSTTHLASANTYAVPYWLKLVRSGNTFTGYVSSDGVSWTQVASTTFTMASSATEGLAVCAHSNSVLNTSTFDNVLTTTP